MKMDGKITDHADLAFLNEMRVISVSETIPSLTLPSKLITLSNPNQWTNYTLGFKGTLDYIWLEKEGLQSFTVAPFPNEMILAENVALPSPSFPSDHLSVISDIQFA